jgi:hypothetical protein
LASGSIGRVEVLVWARIAGQILHGHSLMPTARLGRLICIGMSFFARLCSDNAQPAGDAMLLAFDATAGNTINAKFWPLHCFRRGARSQVSRGGMHGRHRFKKALKTQVHEHGRWRNPRSGEDVDVICREWTLLEKIQITLHSM